MKTEILISESKRLMTMTLMWEKRYIVICLYISVNNICIPNNGIYTMLIPCLYIPQIKCNIYLSACGLFHFSIIIFNFQLFCFKTSPHIETPVQVPSPEKLFLISLLLFINERMTAVNKISLKIHGESAYRGCRRAVMCQAL